MSKKPPKLTDLQIYILLCAAKAPGGVLLADHDIPVDIEVPVTRERARCPIASNNVNMAYFGGGPYTITRLRALAKRGYFTESDKFFTLTSAGLERLAWEGVAIARMVESAREMQTHINEVAKRRDEEGDLPDVRTKPRWKP